MLAKINWSFFVKPEERETNLKPLIDRIQEDIAQSYSNAHTEETDNITSLDAAMNIHCNNAGVGDDTNTEHEQSVPPQIQFWDRHFVNRSEVNWDEFKESFLSEYGKQLAEDFGDDRINWLMQLMYKDIFEHKSVMKREAFDRFIGKIKKKAGGDVFYNRLTDYAIGSLAIREVFDMESTVRLTAIQNLGQNQHKCIASDYLHV